MVVKVMFGVIVRGGLGFFIISCWFGIGFRIFKIIVGVYEMYTRVRYCVKV